MRTLTLILACSIPAIPQSFHREDLGAVPVIDAHTHYVRDLPADLPLATVEKELEVRLRVMDALNIRKAVVLCSGWGKEQPNVEHASSEKAAFHLLRKAPGRFVVFTTVDFGRMDRPDFSAGAVRHLEETVRAGARGLKLELGKPAVHWMPMDDPRLDAVYDKAAELGIPVALHSSDPEEFFQPPNRFNWWLGHIDPAKTRAEDRGYWHVIGQVPSRETLHRERENVLRKHRNTTFILVHMGWLSRQLPLLADILERYPRVQLDLSAAVGELARSPAESAAFLNHYAGRVLFGTDMGLGPASLERGIGHVTTYFRLLETDAMQPAEPPQRGWNVSGLKLPAATLKRISYENAAKLLEDRSHANGSN